jgi:hypothetical protein
MAVTEADVIAIMQTSVDTAAVPPFLALAALIRSEDLAASSYSDDRKDQIEKWLAAHFLTMGKDHGSRIQEEDIEQTYRARYSGEFGLALNHTRYGQVVLQLDDEGVLTQPEPGGGGVALPAIFEVH